MRTFSLVGVLVLLQGCGFLGGLNSSIIGDNQIAIPPLNTMGLGEFQGFYCGYGDSAYPFDLPSFIGLETGGLVTYEEALDVCASTSHLLEINTSMYCTWRGEPIYLREVEPGDCDDARLGGEPGDGICGVDPELTVITSYEARGDHSGGDHPIGDTNVHIERPGPQILVLGTYEPVRWHVTTGPGVELIKIIASGYHEPIVEAPAEIPVERLWVEEDSEYVMHCPGPFPDTDLYSGCATPIFFDRVEEHTGLEITSYYNCYQLTDITVHSDLSVDSSCDAEPEGYYSLTCYTDPDCGVVLGEDDCGRGGSVTPGCGDGVVQQELGEECDDGNTTDEDGCSADCLAEDCNKPAIEEPSINR